MQTSQVQYSQSERNNWLCVVTLALSQSAEPILSAETAG